MPVISLTKKIVHCACCNQFSTLFASNGCGEKSFTVINTFPQMLLLTNANLAVYGNFVFKVFACLFYTTKTRHDFDSFKMTSDIYGGGLKISD